MFIGNLTEPIPPGLRYLEEGGEVMTLNRRILFILAFILIPNFACTDGPPPNGTASLGTFQEAPCPLELPEGVKEGKDVRCGYVNVPEFHAKPEGRSFRIPVAIVHALSELPASDPFVVAPSGPGDSALNIIADVTSPGAGVLRQDRDVVLIEFRGLPRAEPSLVCPEIPEYQREGLDKNLSGEQMLDLRLQALMSCKTRLETAGIDLDAFNYVETAADLDMITTALGYDKFNLYGTSAGTILAQHMLKDYPNRLRSVIIDSAVPLGRGHDELAAISGRILNEQFEACARDAECSKAYPGLAETFEETIERLNRNPVTLEVQLRTGEKVAGVLNGARLAETVLMSSAQTNMIPWLPSLLYAIGQGHDERLQDIAGSLHPHEGFSWGLGLSVICSESAGYTEEEIVLGGILPVYEEAVTDASWGPKSWAKICPVWGVDRISSEYRQPVVSDVPTLVLAGQFDAITPPSWAYETAQSLSNSFVYEIPGYGHSATFGGPCPASIALQFLTDPTTAPDTSCTGQMKVEYQVN